MGTLVIDKETYKLLVSDLDEYAKVCWSFLDEKGFHIEAYDDMPCYGSLIGTLKECMEDFKPKYLATYQTRILNKEYLSSFFCEDGVFYDLVKELYNTYFTNVGSYEDYVNLICEVGLVLPVEEILTWSSATLMAFLMAYRDQPYLNKGAEGSYVSWVRGPYSLSSLIQTRNEIREKIEFIPKVKKVYTEKDLNELFLKRNYRSFDNFLTKPIKKCRKSWTSGTDVVYTIMTGIEPGFTLDTESTQEGSKIIREINEEINKFMSKERRYWENPEYNLLVQKMNKVMSEERWRVIDNFISEMKKRDERFRAA